METKIMGYIGFRVQGLGHRLVGAWPWDGERWELDQAFGPALSTVVEGRRF